MESGMGDSPLVKFGLKPSYGPPLFDPHDDQNIPAFTNDTPNTLNYVGGYTYSAANPSDTNNAPQANDIINQILNNSVTTFDTVENNDGLISSPSAYHDIRSSIGQPNALVHYDVNVTPLTSLTNQQYGYLFKVTMPQDLGGHVFNKFFRPPPIDDAGNAIPPVLDQSYTKYDLNFKDSSSEALSVSSILSQSVSSMSIFKEIDQDKQTSIKSTLNITLTNLNRSDEGFKILQFMRQNVAVLKYLQGMVKCIHISRE